MDNQNEQKRSEQISQDGRQYIQSFLRENIGYESLVFPLESGKVNLIKKIESKTDLPEDLFSFVLKFQKEKMISKIGSGNSQRDCATIAASILKPFSQSHLDMKYPLFTGSAEFANSRSAGTGFAYHVLNISEIFRKDGTTKTFLAIDMTANHNLDANQQNYNLLVFQAGTGEELKSLLKNFFKTRDWGFSTD